MKPKVYFTDFSTNHFTTIFDKVSTIFNCFDIERIFCKDDAVAVKLSFGEWGNLNSVRPQYILPMLNKLKEIGAKPFLTDTNTLYSGMRTMAVSHIENAILNGYGYECLKTPIIIADGIKGNNHIECEINCDIFKKVKIASDICFANSLLCISHFKLHEMAGFGASIKNLGMGCSSKAGKLDMHSKIRPNINKRCRGCGACKKFCFSGAIFINENKQAEIDNSKCTGCGNCVLTCRFGALKITWDDNRTDFQKRMVEYAYGAAKTKFGKSLYINFLNNIAPVCDCVNYTPHTLIDDIGIVASEDPVACDKASMDIVNEHCLKSGYFNSQENKDFVRSIHPEMMWEEQLKYGEKIGLGVADYELISLSKTEKVRKYERLAKKKI